MRVTLRGLEWSSCFRACKSNTASSTTASFDCCSTRAGGGGRHTAGLLCLFAPARQPQAFTIDPRLYLSVTRLAQHLALHPKRAAFGAKVGAIADVEDLPLQSYGGDCV